MANCTNVFKAICITAHYNIHHALLIGSTKYSITTIQEKGYGKEKRKIITVKFIL